MTDSKLCQGWVQRSVGVGNNCPCRPYISISIFYRVYPDLAHLLWPAQYHKCMITVCFYACECRPTCICLSCRTAAMPTWPRSSSQAVRALKTRLPVPCRSGTKWSPRRSNGESGCSLPPMGTVWEASWSTWRVSRTWPQFGYCHSGSASQTSSFYIEIKK